MKKFSLQSSLSVGVCALLSSAIIFGALPMKSVFAEESQRPNLASVSVTVGGKGFCIGDSSSSVLTSFGKPDRQDPSAYNLTWYVYNHDYQNFLMVGIGDNDKVVGFFSDAATFSVNNSISMGSSSNAELSKKIQILVDKFGTGKVCGAYLYPSFYINLFNKNAQAIMEADSLQNLDATNALRVAYGIAPLKFSKDLQKTALAQSLDLTKNDLISHKSSSGKTFSQRLKEANIKYADANENISIGARGGIQAFAALLLVDKQHRDALLNKSYTHIGVGEAYNKDSSFKFILTQDCAKLK